MKTVALYVRVSSEKQEVKSQKFALKELAQRKGWENVTWYVDEAFSGALKHRPAFDQMLTAIEEGKHDIVAAYKLDRIGRSMVHLLDFIKIIQANEVGLVFMKEEIDTKTPVGNLFFNIIGSVAQFERELMIDRMKTIYAAKKENGEEVGRKRGVDWQVIYSLRSAGMEAKEIALKLGVSEGHVRRIVLAKRREAGV